MVAAKIGSSDVTATVPAGRSPGIRRTCQDATARRTYRWNYWIVPRLPVRHIRAATRRGFLSASNKTGVSDDRKTGISDDRRGDLI